MLHMHIHICKNTHAHRYTVTLRQVILLKVVFLKVPKEIGLRSTTTGNFGFWGTHESLLQFESNSAMEGRKHKY